MPYARHHDRKRPSDLELLLRAVRFDPWVYLVIAASLLALLFLPSEGRASRPAPLHRPCITRRHQHRHHDHAHRLRGRRAGAEMPTLGQGPRGFKDWQREGPWDGPTLIPFGVEEHTGVFQTPVVETSRYGYLMGRLFPGGAPVLVKVTGFADVFATKQTSQVEFMLDPEVLRYAQFHLPILGPFTRVTFAPATALTKWTLNGGLFLTNRYYPTNLVAEEPFLMNVSHLFGPGESVILYPLGYFAGPARVFVNKEAQTLEVSLEVEVEVGVWSLFDFHTIAAATSTEGFNVLLPAGAWRVVLKSAGAQTAVIHITPSLTGST